MIFDSIDALDSHITTNATPANRILFEAQPNSGIIARLLIIARRPSDGAQKSWDLTAAMRRQGGGVSVNLDSVGGGVPLGSAGDLISLALVSIAFFADANGNIGATLTGLAGSTINWGIMLRGIQVVD